MATQLMRTALSRRGLASAPRVAGRVAFARGYAEEAPARNENLKLTLTLPHSTPFDGVDAESVYVNTWSGVYGIMSGHTEIVDVLLPGVVEVEQANKDPYKLFVPGGTVFVHEDNSVVVNAVDGFPLDAFSPENVSSELAAAQKDLSSSDEGLRAEAEAKIQALEAIQEALK